MADPYRNTVASARIAPTQADLSAASEVINGTNEDAYETLALRRRQRTRRVASARRQRANALVPVVYYDATGQGNLDQKRAEEMVFSPTRRVAMQTVQEGRTAGNRVVTADYDHDVTLTMSRGGITFQRQMFSDGAPAESVVS